MKTNNLFSISALCAAMTLCVSCVDDVVYTQEQYQSVVYMKNSGLTNIDFFNIGEDMVYSTGVGRGGTNQALTGTARLEPFTPEELAAYNAEGGTSYVQLPADCYTIAQPQIDFAANQEFAEVEIVLKSNLGDLPTGNYILPIYLRSDQFSVNSNYERLILHPSVVTPLITFSMEEQMYSAEEALGTTLSADTYSFPIVLDYGDNTKDFDVYFQKGETELQSLVDNYNAANGTSYTLLPSTAYSFDEKLSLTGGVTSGELLVTLSQEGVNGLEEGEYLLPIQMTRCELAPFDVDTEDVRYLSLKYTTMRRISLSSADIDGVNNRANAPLSNMVDGDIATFYQAHVNDGRTFDGQTCIYFDMDLKESYSEIELSYISYNNGSNLGVPYTVRVYASNDGTNWNLIARSDDPVNGFLDQMQATVSPEDLTVLPAMETGAGGARYIRLCFMDYRWQRANGTYTIYPITNGGLSFHVNELEVRATPMH